MSAGDGGRMDDETLANFRLVAVTGLSGKAAVRVVDELVAARRELGDTRARLAEAHDVLREVADMWTGKEAFMPVATILRARAALGATDQAGGER